LTRQFLVLQLQTPTTWRFNSMMIFGARMYQLATLLRFSIPDKQMYLHNFIESRVTRLGEHSLIRWLLTLGSFCENYRSSTNNLATFFLSKIYILVFTKMGWAAFWATFSRTHLVTLIESENLKVVAVTPSGSIMCCETAGFSWVLRNESALNKSLSMNGSWVVCA
jgi:hypothetical protein